MLESISEMADRLFPLLRRSIDGPVALFGHSMGATLAFELARSWEESGSTPHALFVSARTAPSRHRTGGTVHLRTDEELIERIRSLDGTDRQVLDDEELLRLALPVLRADYKAAETYAYRSGPPLNCPVHAFTGDQDPLVNEHEARAWADHTRAAFTLHTYTGGHFYLVDHRADILDVVRRRLGLS
ncbi:alpha/beta fold hydrolase [Streptomyces griseorubiginosus]|uniref:thioesterase II family protein n=1 Tax=Streptomyces griseorubiginosus TaxID=67304 RepID=UPI0033BB513B